MVIKEKGSRRETTFEEKNSRSGSHGSWIDPSCRSSLAGFLYWHVFYLIRTGLVTGSPDFKSTYRVGPDLIPMILT
jgi:hypothetical protein